MTKQAITQADWIISPGTETPALQNASLIINAGRIEAIGPADAIDTADCECFDARGMVLIPGLINTHGHFLQTLTRALPAAQNSGVIDWQRHHLPLWLKATPEALQSATGIAAAELLLSGCTASMDHNYLWPNGCRVDDQVEVMQHIGMRFHVARGAVSQGEHGEDEALIVADYERIISHYHDPSPGSMLQVILAPCSPYSVSPALMRDTAALARQHHIRLHTHLAESQHEVDWCRSNLGETPVSHVESLDWLGDDVWFAHGVHLSSSDIVRLGVNGCGITHCPCSNMRLGSGVAAVSAMRARGIPVGLGVDGAASNDSANLLAEARQALLLQRVTHGADALTAEQALSMATREGAALLGRSDIGELAPGKAADIVGYRLDRLELAGGAVHDPLGALVFCAPARADWVMVNGKTRVKDAMLVDYDLNEAIATHNALASALTEP